MEFAEAAQKIADYCSFMITSCRDGDTWTSISDLKQVANVRLRLALKRNPNRIEFQLYSELKMSEPDLQSKVRGPWILSELKEKFEEQSDILVIESSTSSEKSEGMIAVIKPPNDDDVDWTDWDNQTNERKNVIKTLYDVLCSFWKESLPDTATVESHIRRYNTENASTIATYIQNWKNRSASSAQKALAKFTPSPVKTEDKMMTTIQSLLKSNLNVILTGAPGTGKTYTAKEVAKAMVGAKVPKDATEEEKSAAKKAEEERIQSVQFHPGYDYSDFVIGMKPVLVSNEGKEVFDDESGRLYTTANNKKDGKPTDFSGTTSVSFVWRDGIFKHFADKAKNDLGNNYVFLIDEINRADLSRVFGELFSLLEEEYRYPNNPKGITLPNGKNFVIPRNLYIIGTMNDIDRSVESMDFALRRRFAWKEVKAEDSVTIVDSKAKEGKITKWDANLLKGAMKAVNSLIAPSKADEQPGANQSAKAETPDLRLGREYQLGGAIFAKLEKYVKDAYGNVRYATPDNFDALWSNHIENILSEYLRGRRDRDDTLKVLHNAYQEAYKKEVVLPKDEENAADPGGTNGQDAEGAERKRGENRKFRVNYRGEVIQGKTGTETLVAFVKKLSDDDIQKIAGNREIQRSGLCFLVKDDPGDKENYTYVDEKKCYIVTKSGTDEKRQQVNKIAEILQLGDVRAEPVND